MTPLRAMSFAPPKQNTPPARVSFESGSPDPVHGRLARAATGVSYDVSSEDVTVSPGGTRRLWLVESERAPRSPGVATVAAVSSAAQPGIARNLGFGAGTRGGACRSEHSDPHKGPAFAHLLRQNELLAKRLTAAHGFLAKAFGGGKEITYMTTALRMKSGAHALKCVAEAVLLGDALLANWDAAWGLQLRHLTRAKERAEGIWSVLDGKRKPRSLRRKRRTKKLKRTERKWTQTWTESNAPRRLATSCVKRRNERKPPRRGRRMPSVTLKQC